MQRLKLRWLAQNDKIVPPSDYQVNQVWCLKRSAEASAAPIILSQPGPLPRPKPAVVSNSSNPIDLDSVGTAPFSPLLPTADIAWDLDNPVSLTTCEPVKQKRLKAKLFYPGLSVVAVSPKGKMPKCAGCRIAIERGSYQLVKKDVVNQEKRWTQAASYHFKRSCFSSFPLNRWHTQLGKWHRSFSIFYCL